jgi:hypothetical protein
MAELTVPGNGRKIEYRSVITLGNLMSILAMVVTVSGAVMLFYGDVQARLAALEIRMEFAQAAINAVAQKMGIEPAQIGSESNQQKTRSR